MANATERALRRKRKRAATTAAKPPRTPVLPRKGHHHQKKHLNKIRKHDASNPNLIPLGHNALLETKGLRPGKGIPSKAEGRKEKATEPRKEAPLLLLSTLPAAQQLRFFLASFQSDAGFRFSCIELEAFKESAFVELDGGLGQDARDLCSHLKKGVFQGSWEEELCGKEVIEGKVEPGSPIVLVVSSSATRTLELLRGLRKFTTACKPAKLFAKHMKLDEQVQFLKGRVNIASGTPSRIKKLIDIEALSLSRLSLVVLDMQRDAKGYSLFNLPQVCNEFWDLYKHHLNQRLVNGELRICFYGLTAVDIERALEIVE